jgi:hypothetical protein
MFVIEKMANGTYVTRSKGGNNRRIGGDKAINSKPGAYKNLRANAKLWAKAMDLTFFRAGKVRGKAELFIEVGMTDPEGKVIAKQLVSVPVKEINC